MKTFSEYDNAAADHHTKSNIRTVPVMSWDFHHEFVAELRALKTDALRLQQISEAFNWDHQWDFTKKLQQQTILVTDAKLLIVFASENMTLMNGYKESEVLGKTPKIFQGKDTDRSLSKSIRKAVGNRKAFEATLLNYKKNGTTYHCHVKGFPVFDKTGNLCHFIAFETAA